MKKYIKMSQTLAKVDDSEITEAEMDEFIDAFIELVESLGFETAGGYELKSEEVEVSGSYAELKAEIAEARKDKRGSDCDN